MKNLQRSSTLSLLAGGLVGTALLLPAAALAQQGAPRIIKRTVETVEVLDDGSGYPNQQVYIQPYNRPTYRQSYAPATRPVVVRQPVYQAYQQPVYQQPAYQQPDDQEPAYQRPYQRPYRQAYAQPVTMADAQQQQQSCQIGRLVGGLVGGGIGYAASRQDGRAWVVPLGALLGTQVGCNAAIGKGPTLW